MTTNMNDLYSKINISLTQALSGSFITLKSPAGKKIRLKLREGIQDGQVLRIAGEGLKGEGGSLGDLFIQVMVMDHPIFKPEGLDIHCNLEITPALALYGGSIQVEGPADGKIPVRIPENSQSGDQIRIAGHGFAGKSRRGDLVLDVRIVSDENPRESNAEILRHKIRSEWLN